MRERATLKLDAGDEVRVEVDRVDLDRDEIVVHRTEPDQRSASGRLLDVIDRHLATASPHPSGTTDRLLQADRDRPY